MQRVHFLEPAAEPLPGWLCDPYSFTCSLCGASANSRCLRAGRPVDYVHQVRLDAVAYAQVNWRTRLRVKAS